MGDPRALAAGGSGGIAGSGGSGGSGGGYPLWASSLVPPPGQGPTPAFSFR